MTCERVLCGADRRLLVAGGSVGLAAYAPASIAEANGSLVGIHPPLHRTAAFNCCPAELALEVERQLLPQLFCGAVSLQLLVCVCSSG